MSDEESIESLKNAIKKQQNEIQFGKDRISKLEKELASTKSASIKLKKVTAENTELKTQVTELEERIEQLDSATLEKELKENKERITSQAETITELNEKTTKLISEKADMNSKIEAQESNLEETQGKIDSLSKELKESEKKGQENEKTISSLNSNLEELKNELNETKDLISTIDEVKEGLQAAQTDIQSKDETTNNLHNEIKEQKSEIDELKISIDKKGVENQELVTKITELESSYEAKDEEITSKAKKIDELTKHVEHIEAGVDLYQNTIKELKHDLDKRKQEIRELEQKKMETGEAAKYEKQLENKDKTISILKKEISDLTVKITSLESSEGVKISLSKDIPGLASNDIIKSLEGKLSEDEQNKLISLFNENDEKVKELQSLIKKQKSELEKNKSEIGKNKSELDKQKMEINKLKTELKDKEKNLKKLEKDLRRSKKDIQDLESEVDIESAITQVEKKKKVIAKIDELNKLRERIDTLEESIEWEKQQNAELQQKYTELESSADAEAMIQQKKTYESYILTLQTESYDVKHQLEESENLRSEQAGHIDRLEALIAQVSAQIDQQEAISPSEPLLDPSRAPQIQQLLGQQAKVPTEQPADQRGLLGNRPRTPGEEVDHERSSQIMEFYSELTNKFTEITDMAFIGFNGELYFQTSPWDIQDDVFKLIQDWKAEAPAIWINKLKYATIKATSDILVATNVQGKGHLLCAALDEKIFMICYIDIKGDALLLYEDFQPLLPHLKKIFDNYEQKKTELL